MDMAYVWEKVVYYVVVESPREVGQKKILWREITCGLKLVPRPRKRQIAIRIWQGKFNFPADMGAQEHNCYCETSGNGEQHKAGGYHAQRMPGVCGRNNDHIT